MFISEITKKTKYIKYEDLIIYDLRVDFEVFDEEESELFLLKEWIDEYRSEIIITDMSKFLELQKKNCDLFAEWLQERSDDDDSTISLSDRPFIDYIKEGVKVKGFSDNNEYYGYIHKIKEFVYTTDHWWVEKNPITSAIIAKLKLMKDKLTLREFLKIMKILHLYFW